MSAQTTTEQEVVEIDLLVLFRDFMHGLKRLWWIVILLTVIGAGSMYFSTTVIYSPNYTAEASVSVRAVNSSAYYDDSAATAELLGNVFPYILTSGILQDIVAEDLGMTSMPGSISVTNIEGTNLLTIRVRAQDGETAYAILQSFIRNYPSVAQYVVGQTELTVIDDSGVPENSGKASVLRGSVRNGALAGVVLGMAIVLLYVITFKTIRTSSDLKEMASAPYLGTLPIYLKKQRASSDYVGVSILEKNAQDNYVEAMNVICTRLERQLKSREKKTFMVTSAIPGEGKSTVAANMAASFAKKGKKVILVDCDLRNPTTKKVFRMSRDFPGIREVLLGKETLKSALYRMPGTDNRLYCLFGPTHGTREIEILGSEKMGKLLKQFEEVADLVILDTPPSAMLLDASILSKFVKDAVFVVQSDFARKQYILKGMEELNDIDVKIDGVVLNGGTESSSSSSGIG